MKSSASASSVVNDAFCPLPDQVRRCLGLLDNDDHFAWRVVPVPIDDQTCRAGPQPFIGRRRFASSEAGTNELAARALRTSLLQDDSLSRADALVVCPVTRPDRES